MTHEECLKVWTRLYGADVAEQKLQTKRDRQREASRKFYAKYSDRVVGWVRRYQVERNPANMAKCSDIQDAKRWTEQERAAGRPRPLFCDVCGQPDQSGRKLAYDHCHAHGHFRGWLCGHCNRSIGLARDDPETLMRMALYIQMDRDKNWPKT